MNTIRATKNLLSTLRKNSYVEGALPALSRCHVPNLQSHVSLLANSITEEPVRLVVGKVLADLVFLLDYLSLAESTTDDGGRIVERLSILDAVRHDALLLVEFIESCALQAEGIDESLRDVLDGTGYAIKLELRRIFEYELNQLELAEEDQKSHGLLLYAQGVLTNCFQQCMINIAGLFDESVSAEHLFHDWAIRRERSLRLYRDLEALIELIRESNTESLETVAEELQSFKDGTMQWLMYKDWHGYEVLSESVIYSIRNGENPSDLLHRLQCYLETLHAHVKARAVLADLAEPRRVHAEMVMV